MKTQVRGPRLLLSAGIALTLAIGMLSAGKTAYAGSPEPPVGLGTATPYAVLAGTAVTNTGPSTITGDLGVHPGSSVSGFPPGTVSGMIHAADAVALAAKNALGTAYDDAAARTPFTTVAGGLLTGQPPLVAVYRVGAATPNLTGPLTLDGQNDPSSVWIFQLTSDLITASGSSVDFIRGGSPCNVFWQVVSSATLGSGSTFVGTIMALQSITINTDVTVNGRALAREGNVTLDDDTIGSSTCPGLGTLPSAAPSLSSSAFSPENEAVSPWSLFLVLSGIAAVFISFIVTVRRLTARQGI